MKLCVGNRVYDVQNDRALGFVVSRNGRIVRRDTQIYEAAGSEFKRAKDEERAEAEVQAKLRSVETA